MGAASCSAAGCGRGEACCARSAAEAAEDAGDACREPGKPAAIQEEQADFKHDSDALHASFAGAAKAAEAAAGPGRPKIPLTVTVEVPQEADEAAAPLDQRQPKAVGQPKAQKSSVGSRSGVDGSRSSTSKALGPIVNAAKLRSMAKAGSGEAWEKLRTEYATQKKVWESVALSSAEGQVQQAQVKEVQSKIELALAKSKASPTEAVKAIEAALALNKQAQRSGGPALSKSTEERACEALRQARAADARRELARRLDSLGSPQELPAKSGEVEALIATATLKDLRLVDSVLGALVADSVEN